MEQTGRQERTGTRTGKSDAPGVRVFAPGTVSNFGPGFDCFGFALEEPGDVVEARPDPAPGVRVDAIEGSGNESLPREADRNTASVAVRHVWNQRAHDVPFAGIALRIHKGIPPGSGLGSSAASAAAGAEAAMRLLGQAADVPYDLDLVLDAALAGEAVAAGQRHADNVAPAVLGGFTIVQSVDPLEVARIEPTLDLRVTVVLPAMSIATREARAVLPKEVSLAEAVTQWSRAAGVVAALLTGDLPLLEQCLVDRIVEPHRARLIPGFEDARAAALEAGAAGFGISGAGPTLFAVATTDETAHHAGAAIRGVFRHHDLASTSYVTRMSPRGARVL